MFSGGYMEEPTHMKMDSYNVTVLDSPRLYFQSIMPNAEVGVVRHQKIRLDSEPKHTASAVQSTYSLERYKFCAKVIIWLMLFMWRHFRNEAVVANCPIYHTGIKLYNTRDNCECNVALIITVWQGSLHGLFITGFQDYVIDRPWIYLEHCGLKRYSQLTSERPCGSASAGWMLPKC